METKLLLMFFLSFFSFLDRSLSNFQSNVKESVKHKRIRNVSVDLPKHLAAGGLQVSTVSPTTFCFPFLSVVNFFSVVLTEVSFEPFL